MEPSRAQQLMKLDRITLTGMAANLSKIGQQGGDNVRMANMASLTNEQLVDLIIRMEEEGRTL